MNIYERSTLALAAVAVMTWTTSCAKRNNLNRIEGEWEVVGGNAFDDDDYEYTFEFEEDGDFRICAAYGTYSYCNNGEWSWDGDLDSDLELELDGETTDVEIEELTRDEMTLDYDGDRVELEKVEG